MRNPISIAACLAALLLFALPGLAQDLYVAEAVVADESSETRNAKLSELLAEVMVRVSGNAGIASQPAAAEVMAAAPSLVQQFRYRTTGDGEQVERRLWARFDAAAVDRMMRERHLPVWVQRPRVLLWLAAESNGRRELLNLETLPDARDSALQRAGQRGMPLQLPLMDLEDQAALQPADLWSNYGPGIRAASARYPSDAILLGRLSARADGNWQGGWSLLDGGDTQEFQSPALALPAALDFALDQAHNLLAARHAPMPGSGATGGTLVRFGAVRGLADYGRLIAVLSALEPVASLALRYAGDDAVIFEFRLRGSAEDLVRALESSGSLVAEPPPGGLTVSPQGSGAVAPVSLQPAVELAFRLVN